MILSRRKRGSSFRNTPVRRCSTRSRQRARLGVIAMSGRGEYAGKVKVGKLDVDSNGNTAMRYNIRGIPTLLLFKNGQVVEQIVGAVGKSQLQKMLDPHLVEV